MLHNNEMVNIEEDTILGVSRSMIRRFTFHHRVNQLSISVLTSGASLSSCKLDLGRHEIIVNQNLLFNSQSSKKNDMQNPAPELSSVEWQSHVLGTDSLLFTTTSAQSVTYHLNAKNELTITGKIRNIQSMSSFYINLNSVNPSSTVDGHFLQVTSPSSETEIASTGDTFIDLVNGCTLGSEILSQCLPNQKLHPGVLFESVCSLRPISKEDSNTVTPVVVAILSFQSKSVRIELQPNIQSNNVQTAQSVIPKLRIRLRKEGISFTPLNMTEFKITYKFRW